MNIKRHPKGTPTGGQFASGSKAESDTDLNIDSDVQRSSSEVYVRGSSAAGHPASGPIGGSTERYFPERILKEDGPEIENGDGTSQWQVNGTRKSFVNGRLPSKGGNEM